MWMTDEAHVKRYVEAFVEAEAVALQGTAVVRGQATP